MLIAGKYQTLRVNRSTENGQYLTDEEENEVLLPNRYVTPEINEGDDIEVFVYHDSENRLVATTETPLVTAGEAACLKVVDKTIHGVFLDWGLLKDLFLPVRNQYARMDVGESYVVFVYTDNVTGRVTATTRFNSFVSNAEISVQLGDEIDIILAVKNELGYRVIINNKHWGMLYSNQIFQEIQLGDKMKAYIHRITEDGRIDVGLRKKGYREIQHSSDDLLEIIKREGGTLYVCDDSKPEDIHKVTAMSKKLFKKSAGTLLKRGIIVMDNEKITLKVK